jgi:hypothetical protein
LDEELRERRKKGRLSRLSLSHTWLKTNAGRCITVYQITRSSRIQRSGSNSLRCRKLSPMHKADVHRASQRSTRLRLFVFEPWDDLMLFCQPFCWELQSSYSYMT